MSWSQLKRGRPLHPLVGLVVLALGFAACAPSDPWTSENPEYALNAFLTALRAQDVDTVWEFLGPQTRQLLEDYQQRQRAALGEDADEALARPIDLLYRAWSPSSLDIDRVELRERDGDRALVAICNVFGAESLVEMERVNGRWTIELALADPGVESGVDPSANPSSPETE